MKEVTTIPLKELVDKFGKIIRTERVWYDDEKKSIYEDKLYTAEELLSLEDTHIGDDFYQPYEDDDRVYFSWRYEKALILTDKGLKFIRPDGDWIQAKLLPDKDLFILAGHDGFDVYDLIKKTQGDYDERQTI